jgi:hypothetical protein
MSSALITIGCYFWQSGSLERLDQSLPLEDKPLVGMLLADIRPIFLLFKNSELYYLAGQNSQ